MNAIAQLLARIDALETELGNATKALVVAQNELDRHRDGYTGDCPTCAPVAEKNKVLADEDAKLKQKIIDKRGQNMALAKENGSLKKTVSDWKGRIEKIANTQQGVTRDTAIAALKREADSVG